MPTVVWVQVTKCVPTLVPSLPMGRMWGVVGAGPTSLTVCGGPVAATIICSFCTTGVPFYICLCCHDYLKTCATPVSLSDLPTLGLRMTLRCRSPNQPSASARGSSSVGYCRGVVCVSVCPIPRDCHDYSILHLACTTVPLAVSGWGGCCPRGAKEYEYCNEYLEVSNNIFVAPDRPLCPIYFSYTRALAASRMPSAS